MNTGKCLEFLTFYQKSDLNDKNKNGINNTLELRF